MCYRVLGRGEDFIVGMFRAVKVDFGGARLSDVQTICRDSGERAESKNWVYKARAVTPARESTCAVGLLLTCSCIVVCSSLSIRCAELGGLSRSCDTDQVQRSTSGNLPDMTNTDFVHMQQGIEAQRSHRRSLYTVHVIDILLPHFLRFL